jgi:hypothetical protein
MYFEWDEAKNKLEVRGNRKESQAAPGKQGMLVMRNNALIEHSRVDLLHLLIYGSNYAYLFL